MRSAPRRWVRPLRPAASLVVVAAWVASLLVAAPVQPAYAATPIADPTLSASNPTRSNSTTPTFTFSPNAAADPVECQWLVGSGTTAPTTGWGPCTTTTSYTPTLSGPDGSYSIWFRSRHTPPPVPSTPPATSTATIQPPDEYSPGVKADYFLNRVGPTLRLVSGPTGTGGVRAVTWRVDATPTFPVTCTLTRNGAPYDTGRCDGAAPAFPAAPLSGDGTYVLTARSTDTDGNTTVSGTLATYVLDTTGPALTLVSGPTGRGRNPSPTWTVTAAGGYPVTCVLTRVADSATVGTATPCTSFTPTPALSRDGDYRLTASATDAAANTRTAVMAVYTLDTVAPVVTVTPASTSSTSAAAGWTVTATDADPTLTVTCALRDAVGTTYGTGTGCAQFTSYTLPAEGSYTLTATATDTAGNVGTGTATWLYRRPPTVTVTTPDPFGVPSASTTGRATTITWTVQAPTTSTLSCVLRRPRSADLPVTCTTGSPVTTALTDGDGTYTLAVTATDPATGGTGSGAGSYLLDTVPLPPFTVTGTSGDTKVPDVAWQWTPPAGTAYSSCQLKQGGTPYGAATTGCTSPYRTTLPADGAWTLDVTLYDAARNATTATSPQVRLDRVPPPPPDVSTPRYLSNNRAPVWTITGEAGATFTCSWTTGVVPAPAGLPPDSTCVSGYAPTLPNVTGTYTLTVTATDAALNTSLPTRRDYQLDVTPPVVTITGSPRSPSNTVTGVGSWTTSGEATATSACTLVRTTNGVGTTVYAAQPCGRTIPVTDAGDGSYVLTVVDTDAAGNPSAPVSSSPFVLDRTPPTAPRIDSFPVSPSQSLSATWTVTLTDPKPSTLECSRVVVVGPGTTSGFAPCTSPVTWTLPGEGRYRLDVRVRDAAGNLSGVVSSPEYEVDRTPPPPAQFTSAAGTGFVTSAAWSWTGEALASAECRLLYRGAPAAGGPGSFHPCTSPQTESLRDGDGPYALDVRLTDRAGNTNAPVTGPTYLLDTVAPDQPVVTGPTGPSRQRTVTWTYTTTETAPPTVYCQLTRSATAGGPATVVEPLGLCTSLTRTLPSPGADGYYVMSVQLKDAAGNLSPVGSSGPYLLDTTPPALPVFTAQPTGTANRADVSWSFTRDADATAECQLLLAGRPVQPWAPCSTPHGAALTYGDGPYVLQVRLTDPVGNVTAPVDSATYTLDRTPPPAPTVSGPTGPSNRTTADYALVGPVEAGATAECRLVFETTPGPWAACTLPTTRTLGADGRYVLEVRLTDPYGNTGPAGASPVYLLDTRPPAVPVVTAPRSPASSPTPQFTFTSDADSTNTCVLTRGTVVVATTPGCRGSFTGALAGLPDGDYVLTVTSVDPAGNSASGSSAPYTYDTTPPPAPVVSGPTGPAQNRTPVFTWTAEPGSSPECSLAVNAGPGSAFRSCAAPYAPSLAADGSWVLTVRLTDAAGNVSLTGSSPAYVLDTTPPAPPTVVAPTSPGRDLAPSWSITAEAGVTAECRLVPPGGTAPAFAACTFPLATPVTGDGLYTLEVRVTDPAGNVSDVGRGGYLLDTLPPAAPVLTDPPGPGRSRTPAIAFTAEPGATTTCRVSRGATVVAATAACTSPVQLDLTGQPDGAYTLLVRATDAAGNIGPAGTTVYVLDTTPPAVPVLTLVPGSPSSDRSPTYAFQVEAGSTPACRVTPAGGLSREVGCAGGTATVDLTGLPDGTYTFAVAARDAAGNVSAAATAAYLLDSTAPAAVRLSGPASPGSNRAPVWKVTSAAPAECRLLRGTTSVKDWAPCGTSYLADLFGQPDAVYAVEARVIGATGATYSQYRLDTTPPAAPTLTAPPSPSTARRPVWTVATAEVAATAECRLLVFGAVLRDWAPCAVSTAGSPYPVDLTGLGDGTYTLAVRITDAARNVGPVGTSDYVLDTAAPTAVGVVAPPSPGNDTTPTWTLSSVAGASLECRLSSGQKVLVDYAPCSATYTADLTGLPDGTYTLTVHALSAAGTPGPETTSSYQLVTRLTAAPTTLTGPTGPSRDRAPTWTFALPAGTTATCKVTTAGRVLYDGPCSSPYTMDLSSAPDGSYTLTVRPVDAAGNLGEAAVAGYVLRTVPAPTPAWTLIPGGPSSSTDPRWGFSVARSTTAQCRRLYNGAVTEDWTACTSPVTLLLVGQPDGQYTLQVRAIDAAGNTSSPISSGYAFDRTALPLAAFTDTPPSPGNDTTPTWLLPAGAGLQCRVSTPRGAGPWNACAGSLTVPTSGDGLYQVELRTVDAAGATGPVSTSSYLLDTQPPPAPRFTEEPPPVGNATVASWSWADDPLLTVECRLTRPLAPGAVFAPCQSPQVVTVSREGSYLLEVRAVDAAGNIGPVTTGSYRYDRTPPPAPVFSTQPPAQSTDPAPVWTFAVPADARATCVVTHNGVVTSDGPCAGSYQLDLRGQLPGDWVLSVRFVDSAGNVGPATVATYTLLAAGRTGFGPGPGGGPPPGPSFGPGAPRPGGGVGPPAGPVGPVFGPPGPGTLAPLPPASRVADVITAIEKAGKAAAKAVVKVPEVLVPGIPPGLGVPDAIKNVLNSTITKPQLPLALLVIVLLFLLVQNRIDRRDPKLAAAPVIAEPDLAFGPRVRPPGPQNQDGGVTA